MGVKTKFSAREIQQMINKYNLGQYKFHSYFKEGVVHTNVLVVTSKGKVVLRYYEHRSREYVLFEMEVLNYLYHHAYPTPKLFKNHKDEFISWYKEKPFAIFEFVPGKHIKKLNKKQQTELIKNLALLNKLLKSYKPKYFHVREGHNKAYVKSLLRQPMENQALRAERMNYLKHQLRLVSFSPSLPKGVVHADYNSNNILFQGDKLVAVLDFDDANYNYLIYDVARMLYHWVYHSGKPVFNFKKAKILIQEYNKFRRLSLLEQKHLFDAFKMVILVFLVRGSAETLARLQSGD